MKVTIFTHITLIGLVAGLALQAEVKDHGGQEHKAQRTPRYRITDLGTLGGAYSGAFGMNNAGEVAGGSATLGQVGLSQTAFLWSRGQMHNLGTLGGQNSAGSGVNDRREVAIGSETGNPDPDNEDVCTFGTHAQCNAAIWTRGRLKPLPSLPGGNNAFAININNRGQVIGASENGIRDPTCLAGGTPFQVYQFEAVVWDRHDSPARKLDPLPDDTVGFAFGINEQGQVVGTSGLCFETALPPAPTGRHAVLWERDGTPMSLGDLGGTSFNIASSINNRGEVVGTSLSSDGTVHAFRWTRRTGIQDLGAYPGAFLTVPPCCNTLNNRGEVVGFALDPDGTQRALVWVDDVPMDLNAFIPKDSGWYLQAAESLNDAGQIVGQGTIHGETHAFLATPIGNDGRDR